MGSTTTSRPLLIPTRPADSGVWMRRDLRLRLLPFGALVAGVWLRGGRPRWLGVGAGRPAVQLGFGVAETDDVRRGRRPVPSGTDYPAPEANPWTP